MTIAKITRAYVRRYSDNGQTVAYVEWLDNRGKAGRTEGGVGPCPCCGCVPVSKSGLLVNAHMDALLTRALREGVPITEETW